MISNYNLSCYYHNFELKDKIYLIPQWALKIIYTDGYNEAVFSGNSAYVTILEGYEINFQEESSFDERFRFSKSVSIKVNGYKTFNDLNNRYCVVLETKEGEFYLVNVDFPSFVTHTYTLNNGTNSTELVFSSQSNIATLKLINFEPNNVNSCKEYTTSKIKNVKLTEAWASYLSTWQKSLVNKGEFVDIEPLPDSVSLTEEFDGEKYTVTLGFDIPMSYYKNDWHIKLLQFEENKYRGYISLEDGNKTFVGYNVGLFPSYTINGDIISIRLTETAIRGIAYGNDYAIIDTDLPNSIEFSGATCHTYNFESSCDWHVEDKPEYITITPTSGLADTQYELTICNTDDETGYEVSEFIIKSCNARVRPEVVIKNPIYRYTATTETVCSEAAERTISSDTYCSGSHNVDKYVDVTKEVSYDSGETWYFASSSSTLVEANSPDCGYRTRTVSTGTTCSGTHNVDKYQLIKYQESYDYGNTWVTVSSTTGSLIEENSPDCGYRTRIISTGTTCEVYDKYELIENQVSYDYGSTWTTTATSTGSIIEYNSEDCSYTPPSFEGKVKLIRNDSDVPFTANCNVSTYVPQSLINSYSATCISAQVGDCATMINNFAFHHFNELSSVTISDNVRTIGGSAFASCWKLKRVYIGSNVTQIDNMAFENAGSFTVRLPNSVTTFGQAVFRGSGVIAATLSSGMTSIPTETFKNCGSLRNVYIPDSITSIGNSAFTNCYSLSSITMSNNITSIGGGAFTNCYNLTSINIPSGVTSINGYVFNSCTGLTSVTIPDAVTTIDEYAFQFCSGLTSVTIPANVTSIGYRAFERCKGLTKITLKSATPPLLSFEVFGSTNNCPIYVPRNSVNAYKSSTSWSTYKSRIYPS